MRFNSPNAVLDRPLTLARLMPFFSKQQTSARRKKFGGNRREIYRVSDDPRRQGFTGSQIPAIVGIFSWSSTTLITFGDNGCAKK